MGFYVLKVIVYSLILITVFCVAETKMSVSNFTDLTRFLSGVALGFITLQLAAIGEYGVEENNAKPGE